MNAFLRELDAILGRHDDAGRERVLQIARAVVMLFGDIGTVLPVSKGAWGKLAGWLMLEKSMNRSGPEVLAKMKEAAKRAGNYADWLFQSL